MQKLFGTDGIRGRVNRHPMDPETVLKVGMAAAMVLKKERGRNMVLIGKDTRLSGYMLESALTSGICAMGMNVTLTGPIPTPGIAFLTKTLRLDAGVVISASHNHYEDNGIKFFGAEGFKLPDSLEAEIEQLVSDETAFSKRAPGAGIGKAFRLEDAKGRYIEYIKSTIPKGETLEGLKIVVDCANGAAYKITPWVLEELGAHVITIHDRPDGVNINEGCGSLDISSLKKAVLEHGADAGVAHDGDADRTILVDEKGNVVDGDHMMGIWGVQLKNEGRLAGDTVVATVMSNLGLEHFFASHGIKMTRAKVGDRYVAEQMQKGNYILGGEQSGHIINLLLNTTGDGPITALHIIRLVRLLEKPLSALRESIRIYPQELINVEIKKAVAITKIPGLEDLVKDCEKQLGDSGRVLVRASGTEPKIRVMVEGSHKQEVNGIAVKIASFIKDNTA